VCLCASYLSRLRPEARRDLLRSRVERLTLHRAEQHPMNANPVHAELERECAGELASAVFVAEQAPIPGGTRMARAVRPRARALVQVVVPRRAPRSALIRLPGTRPPACVPRGRSALGRTARTGESGQGHSRSGRLPVASTKPVLRGVRVDSRQRATRDLNRLRLRGRCVRSRGHRRAETIGLSRAA
jgi:hypothetical protein